MDLEQAIKSLYEIAVEADKSTSTLRLAALAEVCVARLAACGLTRAESEVSVPGGGRDKQWDVAWKWAGKYRLVLSLKSILANLSGTVPNRIDDLMGETANIQLYSPEIVAGYVMVFDTGKDKPGKDGVLWCDKLARHLDRLAVRRAPYWTPGTFEGYAIVRVDFTNGPRLIAGGDMLEAMLISLADEVRVRNPGIK